MSKKKDTENKVSSGVLALLLKQTISGIICFTVVFAMNTSDNVKIKNYATSLGYALRAEFDFYNTVQQLKEHLPFLNDNIQTEGMFQ